MCCDWRKAATRCCCCVSCGVTVPQTKVMSTYRIVSRGVVFVAIDAGDKKYNIELKNLDEDCDTYKYKGHSIANVTGLSDTGIY